MAFLASFPSPSPAASVSVRTFPVRRNPDTVYPAPGQRNRPHGSKEFGLSTRVEETTVVMWRELLSALTPRSEPPRVESRFDDILRPTRQRLPIVEFDEQVIEKEQEERS